MVFTTTQTVVHCEKTAMVRSIVPVIFIRKAATRATTTTSHLAGTMTVEARVLCQVTAVTAAQVVKRAIALAAAADAVEDVAVAIRPAKPHP